MIRCRIAVISAPVDKSITVSAPNSIAARTFFNSHSLSLLTAELPRFALIFVRAAIPIPIACSPLSR